MLPGGMIDAGHSLFGTALVTAAYLCLILGVIFLAVWLLRRYGPAGIAKPKGTDNPRLLGRLMLGSKQSVCVVRVHGRNLVLGVTEERINLLAETDTPAGSCYEDEDEDDFTRFAEELAQKREQAVNRAAAGDPSDASDSEAHPCAGTGTSGSEQGAGGDEAEQHDRKLASAMSDLEHLAETSRHKG
jgi:flagellar biosynthetic protein FliO